VVHFRTVRIKLKECCDNGINDDDDDKWKGYSMAVQTVEAWTIAAPQESIL
jgi:hypothetical protein